MQRAIASRVYDGSDDGTWVAKFSLLDLVDTRVDDRQSNRSFQNKDGVMPDVRQDLV